jgi:hypothetical protein
MNLFHQHKTAKKQSVSLFDRLSTGLGIFGGCLLLACLMQPKNPANSGRLLAAIAFFGVSVAVERIREDEVASLDRAEGLEKEVKSERIRKEIQIGEKLKEIDEAEQLYGLIPIDRHEEFAEVIGVRPPNYEARQALQQAQQQPQTATATMADPTGDFDPEAAQPTTEPAHYLVPAALVDSWFEAKAGKLPQELIDIWRSNPGKAIEVNNGKASIIRGEQS